MMEKSMLRKQALQRRNALTDEEQSTLNRKLLEGFKKLDFSKIRSVHLFLPIIHQKEPDTFLLIDWLQEKHPEIEIVVPKSDFDSCKINNFSYAGKADLITNDYHIPEPQHAKPFIGMPDMVIVPLLAFDQRGFRVGYGKGFYDRFLQNTNSLKIGLSFFEADQEISDVHKYDIKLDQCITPNKIINFT